MLNKTLKISLILLLNLAFIARSQAQKQAKETLFDKADTYIEDKEYDKAIETYQDIMKNTSEKNDEYAKSFYNIGYVLLLKRDSLQAKDYFLRILGSSFRELDRGGKGSGIMQEPYALYKHNACKNLAEIALWERQYDKALKYTQLFDKKYQYRHFCGNEYAENDIYTAMTYARCYLGLNQQEAAITKLLPLVIENGLANNDSLIKLAIQIIKSTNTKDEISAELNKADKTFRETQEKYKKNIYYHYFLTFMGIDIEIPTEYFNLDTYKEDKELEEKYKDNITEFYEIIFKRSKFYRLLTSENGIN